MADSIGDEGRTWRLFSRGPGAQSTCLKILACDGETGPLDVAVAQTIALRRGSGAAQTLWPEMQPRRTVRRCTPFGYRSEETEARGGTLFEEER